MHDLAGRPAGFASLGQDVTEIRALRLEAAQRESEARFQKVADTAPLMIWESGSDGGCTFVNRRWSFFTGIAVEEALGDGWGAVVHPGDFEACRVAYKSAYDARRDFQFEYRTSGEWRGPVGANQRRAAFRAGRLIRGLHRDDYGYNRPQAQPRRRSGPAGTRDGREGWLAGSPTSSTISWAAC